MGLLARRRQRQLERLADAALLPVLLPRRSPRRRRARQALWLAAAACALAAAARPQWGFRWEEVRRRGLDLVVVLDTSNSMLADDIRPNRFEQARWGLRDLVRRLRGDRVALVAFAGSCFVSCPLTVDYAAFMLTLDDLYVGIIPRGGTAVGQALKEAAELLGREPGGADRAIVLVTDGEDHEGDPAALAPMLREKGIHVYAVGVGTAEGGLIPLRTEVGESYLKNREGEVVKAALREDALERLAIGTGGAYVRAAPGDFGLERLYDEGIARLKRAERESRMARQYEERYQGLLGLALLLFGVEALLAAEGRRP